MPIISEPFGTYQKHDVELFTLKNSHGASAQICPFGATVTSIVVPNKKGQFTEVTLGYKDLAGYIGDTSYLGSLVGRYGNRIDRGEFRLNEKNYYLNQNNGTCHLHGGIEGFNKKLWQVSQLDNEHNQITLQHTSPDGEENYPGELQILVKYRFTEEYELEIEYEAQTDQPTILNPTNHCYFNLSGDAKRTILDHHFKLNCNAFTPMNENWVPDGKVTSVENHLFDFREGKNLFSVMENSTDEQRLLAGGVDHNFIINSSLGETAEAVEVYSATSGIALKVLTDQPGVQFYTGNFLDGSIVGREGVAYQKNTGFCLETQHFPNSPNVPSFPSTELRPGELFSSKTTYRFLVK